jgi:hypothetical protein
MGMQPPWCTWIGLHVQSFPQFTPEFFRPELKVAFLGFLAKVALAEFSRVFAFCKIGNEMRCGVGLRESKDDKVLLVSRGTYRFRHGFFEL